MVTREIALFANEYLEALRAMPEQSDAWMKEFLDHVLSCSGIVEACASLSQDLVDRANLGPRLTEVQNVLEQKPSMGPMVFDILNKYFADEQSGKLSPLQAAIYFAQQKKLKDTAASLARVNAVVRSVTKSNSPLVCGICDICNDTLAAGSQTYYTSSEMKEAVRFGYRPPQNVQTFLRNSYGTFGLDGDAVEDCWVQGVLSDATDWALCSKCANHFALWAQSSDAFARQNAPSTKTSQAVELSPTELVVGCLSLTFIAAAVVGVLVYFHGKNQADEAAEAAKVDARRQFDEKLARELRDEEAEERKQKSKDKRAREQAARDRDAQQQAARGEEARKKEEKIRRATEEKEQRELAEKERELAEKQKAMEAAARAENERRLKEERRREYQTIETKRSGSRWVIRVRLSSNDAATLSSDQLSEIAATISREPNFVVSFYLPDMAITDKAWAVSTRRANQRIETRILK